MCYQAQFECPIPKVLGICQGCGGKNDGCASIAAIIFTDLVDFRATKQPNDKAESATAAPANIPAEKINLGLKRERLISCLPANRGTRSITRRCLSK